MQFLLENGVTVTVDKIKKVYWCSYNGIKSRKNKLLSIVNRDEYVEIVAVGSHRKINKRSIVTTVE